MSSLQKNKLALLLWSVSIEQPDRCAAVFVYAAAAAAMDCEVELHFSGASVRLLELGVAEALWVGEGSAEEMGERGAMGQVARVAIEAASSREEQHSVYAYMQEAARQGARFLGCAMALRAQGLDAAALIPEYAGTAGATAFVVRSLDPEWSTLVF